MQGKLTLLSEAGKEELEYRITPKAGEDMPGKSLPEIYRLRWRSVTFAYDLELKLAGEIL